jgi:peptidoglycan hydrolase-like protein with peptidoglycan-binding domain
MWRVHKEGNLPFLPALSKILSHILGMTISKFAVSAAVAVALFGASLASAQTYYPSYTQGSGACVNISAGLSYGQSGTQVSQLQQFLVSQNYPGGGAWMVTGYFGQATVQAVRNFQQSQGLSMSGAVDAATAAAINRVSCSGGYLPGLGGTGYVYNNNYNYNQGWPYSYNYSTYYNYPYGNYYGSYPYNYNSYLYGTTPQLTSLSTNLAAPGSQVTVYGSGFDLSSNTVYVGGTTLSSIPSQNGTALTFTMPANVTGTVSISVGNSHGTSNSLTLSTSAYGYPYNYPPYNYPCLPGQGGYGYTYGGYCPNTTTPVVSYLSPQQGAVGTSVTVYGSGFSSSGNSVHFGNGVIGNLLSFDGHSVSFTVPSTLSGYGYQPIGLGTYQVSVSNSAGATSNSMPFTITSLGSTAAPTISNVTGPTSLQTGVSGTWTLTVNNPSGTYLSTSVNWGDSGTYASQSAPQTTYVQGATTLNFSHAYYAAGTYTVTFTVSNGSGQQNTSSATVSVSGSGGTSATMLSSIAPTSGPVGTQLVLQGSGFDPYNNTVHFGNGGTMHVPSYNGTTIYYTVPAYVSPCDITGGGVCPMYAQLVTPGPYAVYVTSPNGTSGTLNFQVQ